MNFSLFDALILFVFLFFHPLVLFIIRMMLTNESVQHWPVDVVVQPYNKETKPQI